MAGAEACTSGCTMGLCVAWRALLDSWGLEESSEDSEEMDQAVPFSSSSWRRSMFWRGGEWCQLKPCSCCPCSSSCLRVKQGQDRSELEGTEAAMALLAQQDGQQAPGKFQLWISPHASRKSSSP